MLLPGLSLGSPWPASAEGRIGGVFRRACNVDVGDGTLLVLTTPDLPHLPRALKLRVWAPLDQLFRPGTAFRLSGGLWRCGGVRGTSLDVAVWRPPPAGERAPDDQRRLRVAAATACRAAHLERRPEKRLPPDLDDLATRLGSALAGQDDGALRRVAAALVGLGQGLTPSGDDLLVGCLAWLARRPEARGRRDGLADALRPRLAATTPVSRHYLLEALAGRFSEPLVLLADAIDALRPAVPVERAAEAALATGASSGADGIAGLLAAARSDLNGSTGLDHGSLQ
jgi:hypothetical protein